MVDRLSLARTLKEKAEQIGPIDGITIANPDDRSTWSISLAPEATEEQRQALRGMIAGFKIQSLDDAVARLNINAKLAELDSRSIRPLIDAILSGPDTPAADGKTPRQRLQDLETMKQALRAQLPKTGKESK